MIQALRRRHDIVLLMLVLSLSLIFFISGSVCSQDTRTLKVKRQPEIQQVKPKKPVKIKLRRSAENKYTWEITGDDVDEIVRADRRIRKLLKIE
jgi:hypothetical protein